ncbi:tol-pal system-associated acyl-CoA thioesterase [Acidisphaera rubrifaciens]|uniref:4-hydroxybenzoyl-CoA thioesterase n=1 Tax=Acidisphaera rubrifaciens HS-AP3 TaxID=1231350 RepID=A0A0D6P7X0_9PROT|nr:tol-pal system-associated acyl-CoA thioesterase [Acidisphaera rubrifaciens]GAN76959.1 4-hydroxybenzoyl-CoA thioesterase [Acidisphaera rubrifaciens HS-AP3]
MNGHPPATAGQSGHHYPVRVYFEDTDAGGVVYHANYLRYAERGRTEALRAAGMPHATLMERHGLMFVVRRVEVEYLRPARLDDLLDIVTETRAVRGASVVLRQTVRHPDRGVLAALAVRLACVGVSDGRAARLPDDWREALERMVPAVTATDD